MLVAMMILLAGPSPQSLNAPRKAYAACVKKFESASVASKMTPPDYSVAIKSACQAEAANLAKVLIAYDVAMGSKRATAAATAASDVADYVLTSEERFKEMTAPSPR